MSFSKIINIRTSKCPYNPALVEHNSSPLLNQMIWFKLSTPYSLHKSLHLKTHTTTRHPIHQSSPLRSLRDQFITNSNLTLYHMKVLKRIQSRNYLQSKILLGTNNPLAISCIGRSLKGTNKNFNTDKVWSIVMKLQFRIYLHLSYANKKRRKLLLLKYRNLREREIIGVQILKLTMATNFTKKVSWGMIFALPQQLLIEELPSISERKWNTFLNLSSMKLSQLLREKLIQKLQKISVTIKTFLWCLEWCLERAFLK